MTKFRVLLGAFTMLLLATVVVGGKATEVSEISVESAADAVETVPQAVPVVVSEPASLPDEAVPTTTTTAAPVETVPAAIPVTEPPSSPAPVTTVYVAPATTQAPQPTSPPQEGTPAVTTDDAFLTCVARRESGNNPRALNPSSGASGLFQYLDSTWRAMGFASRYGVAKAMYATPEQQWEAARETVRTVGKSPWYGGQYPC